MDQMRKVVLTVLVVATVVVVVAWMAASTCGKPAEARVAPELSCPTGGACQVAHPQDWTDLPACVITLDTRRRGVEREMERIGMRNVQFMDVKRSSRGPVYGIYESHMKAVKTLLERGVSSPIVLVFEDDVRLARYFSATRLRRILHELSEIDFDLCLLGTNADLSGYQASTDHILQPDFYHGFHAIAYNAKSLPRILDFGEEALRRWTDEHVDQEIPRNFVTRACVPMQFAQDRSIPSENVNWCNGHCSNERSGLEEARTLRQYYLRAKLPPVDIAPTSTIAPACLYCFSMGDLDGSPTPEECGRTLGASELEVVLVTPANLARHTKTSLHPAYEYLTSAHRSEYLRAYFMHHRGGGCSDKRSVQSWRPALDELNADEYAYAAGCPVGSCASRNEHTKKEVHAHIAKDAYIFKPYTPLTHEWLNVCDSRLDIHQHALRLHAEAGGHYPMEAEEISGALFHDVCVQYLPSIRRSVPA
jgi:GR25 family glycosyltransferase involved in LPS biosynthesis